MDCRLTYCTGISITFQDDTINKRQVLTWINFPHCDHFYNIKHKKNVVFNQTINDSLPMPRELKVMLKKKKKAFAFLINMTTI